MRRLVVGWLVLSFATVARAEDPRDAFGLGRKQQQQQQQQQGDPRDAFGLDKKPEQQLLDCSDGLGSLRTEQGAETSLTQPAFGCAEATDPLDDNESIYALSTWLHADDLLRLPVAYSTHDRVAHYATGVGRDEAGPSFAGANGLENRWLVEGAPGDGLRTGAADTQVPLTFLEGMWVTAGGFRARDRASTGGVIDARLKTGTWDHEVEARAWAGSTAAARQRAIAANTYFVRRGELDLGPDVAASVVATGPIGEWPDIRWWYAAGIAPELATTKFTWTSQTLVDADNDGVPDGFPGIVTTAPVDQFSRSPLTWRVPVMLRTGLKLGDHRVELTLLGTAYNDVSYLYNSTLQASGSDGKTVTGDAIATWRGSWTNTRARGQLAWHRTMRRESARDPAAADVPQLLSAYVPAMLDEDPVLAAACRDEPPDDRYPMTPNCAVPFGWFASGGAGELVDTTGDRPSITADVAHRIGRNVVRAGATGEDTRLVHESRFTGGMQIRSLFPGHESQRRFVDPAQTCPSDITQPCPTVDTSVLRYRTRYTAAYVEDTWHATDKVAVDGGVRWELMWVGPALHFSNEWSPRLGLSWDPLGGGRSRVWTSMGRSYAHLTAGLGPTIIRRDKTVDRIISMFGEGRSVDSGGAYEIAPGVAPIAQDEVTAGADIALLRAVRARVWLQGRTLRRGLDTTARLGTFRVDNPGRRGDLAAIRETGLFAAELATAPTAKLVLRVGYLYGRTIGSWTGAFDPRQGAVLYAGSDFDGSTVNLLGRLPTDLGHRTYIEAERSERLGSAKLGLAARLTAGSGRPRSVVGETLDGDTVFLVPRGTAGRSPVVTQANIRLSALWSGFDITLDLFNVFNVFNRRPAQTVDETYATGPIAPIDKGSVEDLVFLKNEDGSAANRRTSYGMATSFQSPLSAVLGVSRAF